MRARIALAAVLLVGMSLAAPAQPVGAACVWHRVAAENRGAGLNALRAVDATSATNAWVVGRDDGAGSDTLIEHSTGGAWHITKSPNPMNVNQLYGVEGIGKKAWAVGSAYSPGSKSIILRYDGSNWKVSAHPQVGTGDTFTDVVSRANDDAWAVGQTGGASPDPITEHWDGNGWTVVPPIDPGAQAGFNSASLIPGTKKVWAAGTFYPISAPGQTLVERWNGHAWVTIPSPNPGGQDTRIWGISAISATDAWAVGQTYDGTNTSHTFTMHWDGANWTQIASPDSGTDDNYLQDVAMVGPNDVWAVGWFSPSENPLLLHWNGVSWKIKATPASGQALYGVSSIPGTREAWAVGYDTSSPIQAFTQRSC